MPLGYILIDPLIEFEFRRNVFLPKESLLKKNFIDDDTYFSKVNSHPEVFNHILENALILSKIYALKKQALNCSFTDLLLAGRLMLIRDIAVLVTGNRKDYPECVFETKGIINVDIPKSDKTNGSIKCFSILNFNQQKFNNCLNQLEKLKN